MYRYVLSLTRARAQTHTQVEWKYKPIFKEDGAMDMIKVAQTSYSTN